MATQLENKSQLTEDAQQRLNEGDSFFAAADYSQAINKYKEVIQSNSEYIPALNKLATCCIKMEAEDKAIAVFKRIIDINPNRAMPHAKLARLLSKKDSDEEAIAEYKKALSLDLEQPDWVFMGLGRAIRKLKQAQSSETN